METKYIYELIKINETIVAYNKFEIYQTLQKDYYLIPQNTIERDYTSLHDAVVIDQEQMKTKSNPNRIFLHEDEFKQLEINESFNTFYYMYKRIIKEKDYTDFNEYLINKIKFLFKDINIDIDFEKLNIYKRTQALKTHNLLEKEQRLKEQTFYYLKLIKRFKRMLVEERFKGTFKSKELEKFIEITKDSLRDVETLFTQVLEMIEELKVNKNL